MKHYLQFPCCNRPSIGLYPVVDNSQWISYLLPLGVKTIQLRIKDKNIKDQALHDEIQQSVRLAQQYDARLFINDYWELAIAYNAYGVHLGQEDLSTANLEKIYRAGLRLGISTHCHDELTRAYRCKPSYIALGPIFETTSKKMVFAPQGLDRLKQWRRLSRNYPIVAIGGIHQKNFHDVLLTGVDGIAMISAIVQAKDPRQITQALLKAINNAN